ncbi:MFS transporter [Enteractinococcus coprophilus]|uniref:Putative MFS family arabinose efflux permease n=1 Tax=Enteractinococcus coprophilus TaxID=1027633 RepID=A0A543AP05_9MICC|nr:MFS transporter [Enteractinococcus coprophilus]TQL74311.1 putative MFS family arabinose efflux permease [Enteractinococcus coprophilus]
MTTSVDTITPQQRQRLHRRTLLTVVMSQAFGGAGLAAGISVGALIAQDLLGTEALSGLPTALFTLGAALTAFLIGRATQRTGRRRALGFGFIVGGIGAIGVVIATQISSPVLLFVSLFIYGAGTATNMQTRYAGTDLAPAHRKGTAVSIAMVATTIGAVAGPNLIEPLGDLAERFGLPSLTGPFLLAAVAYLVAGSILVTMLRPDPYVVAKQLQAQDSAQGLEVTAPPVVEKPSRLVRVGALVLVISQMVMVGIMTMTPVHMRAHDHSLGAVGLVIGLHVAAMWLPSLVTGPLVDRVGPRRMAISGGIILLATGLLAAFAPAENLVALVVALMLLGIGWNIGLVSGTTLIVHGTQPDTRAATQGSIDVWYQIFGAGAGVFSGVLMSAAGFGILTVVGGILALIIVPAAVLAPKTHADAVTERR